MITSSNCSTFLAVFISQVDYIIGWSPIRGHQTPFDNTMLYDCKEHQVDETGIKKGPH